jgi:hypothetical protein
MLFQRLLESLDQLKGLDVTKALVVGEPQFFAVRDRWFSPDDRIPGGEKNGLYFYVSNGGDVWYIGKGNFRNGGGIGYRSCSHLGKPERSRMEMFPYHEWAKDASVEQAIRESLSAGSFHIVTLVVEPASLIPLLETFLQTAYLIASGDALPPLNRRVG